MGPCLYNPNFLQTPMYSQAGAICNLSSSSIVFLHPVLLQDNLSTLRSHKIGGMLNRETSFPSTVEEQGSDTPFVVDISKTEASDSIQSHLSTMTSSTRLRIHPSAGVGEVVALPDLGLPSSDGHGHMRRIWASLLGDSNRIPLSIQLLRQENTWASSMAHCVCILYCLLSCLIAIAHLYTNIFNPAMHTMAMAKSFGAGS